MRKLIIFGGIAVVLWAIGRRAGDDTTTAGASASAAVTGPTEPTWSYWTEVDDMSSRAVRYASIESENTVNFDFPYSGPQRGRLLIRTHPRHGRDVVFQIEKGQLLCDEWSGVNRRCPVNVRYDEEGAAPWTAMPPADHSSTAMFFRDYGEFVQRMRGAATVRIQPRVYQEGAPVFAFDVSEFDMDQYRNQ